MSKNTIAIEDKFQELSDIDHILLRAGHVLGNVHSEFVDVNLYKPSTNKMVSLSVNYNAGLLKLVDEVITNSIDERNRSSRLFDIDEINVEAYSNGNIIIKDNGGIPVQIHKVAQVYLPHMIFGRLRTSSNYGGDGDREGAGLNGLGSKLANIFSTNFSVETCDGKKKYYGEWTDNMKEYVDEVITDSKEHYTKTNFKIELSRFDVDKLDIGIIRMIQKRCIDAAASNLGLKVTFKTDLGDGMLNSEWIFEDFQEYIKLHLENPETEILEYKSPGGKDTICILPSIGYNFGFVNGAVCSSGTHMKKIHSQVADKILTILKDEKQIELITSTDIKNEITIFVKTQISNPDYDSQAKDNLTNKIPQQSLNLSKTFLDSFKDSEIINRLIDYYNVKYLKEQKAKLRKLNKELKNTKSTKLITCSSKATKEKKELWLFEGTSAANGFKLARNPLYQACYLLRGKVKNVFNLSKEKQIENLELREIMAVLKLQFGDPKGNLARCPFDEIVIATDADNDGSHITGLLLVFFGTNFPELIAAGKVFRALSPIIVASKGTKEKLYYSQEEYDADLPNLKGWDSVYKKGLGALEDHHYNDFVQNKRLEQFYLEKDYMYTLKVWFDKSTEQRKEILGGESNYQEHE